MKRRFFKVVLILFLVACVKKNLGIIWDFYNFPNPFSPDRETATFRLLFDSSNITEYRWKLEIFTETGNLVYLASQTVSSGISNQLDIQWAGRDNRGNVVLNGIYTSILTLEVLHTSSGYAGNTYTARFSTVVR